MAAGPEGRGRWDSWTSDTTAVVGFAVFAGFLALLDLVLDPLWRWWTGRGVLVEVPVDDVDGARTAYGSTVSVSVDGADTVDRSIDLVPAVVTLLLIWAALWLVARIVLALIDESSGPAVIRWLRWLAGGLLVGPPLLSLVSSAAASRLAERLDLEPLGTVLQVDPAWILAAMLCAVLAQALARAERWRADTEGLI